MKRDYFEKADLAVTICSKDGTILDMNAKSRKTFIKPGMPEIVGQNVLDCHPEPARSLLADMLENPRTNVYTVEPRVRLNRLPSATLHPKTPLR